MVSERVIALFSLLQCNNTQIARFAGCSSGNISKLKTGNREPKPGSRSIAAFAEGVYGYAEDENLLPVLAELCHAPDITREALAPALTAWLFGPGDSLDIFFFPFYFRSCIITWTYQCITA